MRAEIEAERDRKSRRRRWPGDAPRRALGPRRDVAVPEPPFWGARRVAADLRDVWQHLDRNTLFRHHWGGHAAKGAEYERIIREIFEPELAALTEEALRDGWLDAADRLGLLPVQRVGEQLIVFDPDNTIARSRGSIFPRQSDGERLCLADYFRPRRVRRARRRRACRRSAPGRARASTSKRSSSPATTAACCTSTAWPRARPKRWPTTPTIWRAPSSACLRTRACASRWGYAACPDLEEQRKVLPLLRAEQEIGLTLSLSNNLDPEHSTAAIVLHHPETKYFSVRSAA